MDIQLLCPSRGRPDAARELRASFDATKTSPQTRLVFCLDDDDTTETWYPQEDLVVGKPTGDPTGPLNREAARSTADIVGFCGDDSRFETKGWDERVRMALQTPGFAWGWDGHDRPWPSTVFVSKAIVDALGYLALPTMKRGYFDVVWIALAEGTRSDRVLQDVTIRHDNTVHEQPSKEVIHEDYLAYVDWYKNRMAADIEKVQQVVRKGELAHFFPA